MDVDLLRPGTVPISPDTVLWFEFLLNEELLKNHLEKPSCDPSAPELIQIFFNAMVESLKNDSKPIIDIENGEHIPEVLESQAVKLSLKNLALKVLSLKVAATVKWDINLIKSLSFKTQINLLQDLLYFTNGLVVVDLQKTPECDVNSAEEAYLFALLIYHRWVLRTAMNNTSNYSTRNIGNAETPEEMLVSSPENVTRSLTFLNDALSWENIPKVLTFHCFVMLKETSTEVETDWTHAVPLSKEELLAQLHFDLGSFNFFKENYKLARHHFMQCKNFIKNVKESVFSIALDVDDLEGYIVASHPFLEDTQTLLHQMRICIATHCTGIFNILQVDTVKREIPLSYRIVLELDIQGALSSGTFTVARDFLPKIEALNILRCILDNRPAYQYSKITSRIIDSFIWALGSTWSCYSESQKKLIKYHCLQLILSNDVDNLLNKISSHSHLNKMFDDADSKYISRSNPAIKVPEILSSSEWDLLKFTNKRNPKLEIKAMEQQIISSYNHQELRDLLIKISVKNGSRSVWKINPRWQLPIPLQSVLTSLPRGFLQDFGYVLLAKSRELMLSKDWDSSLELLEVLEKELEGGSGNIVAKLSRLVKWDMLLVKISKLLEEWPAPQVDKQTLADECESCLQTNESVLPRTEVMEQCVICLLNLGRWDFLASFDKRWSFFEITAAIAQSCHDFVKYKGNKKVSKDVWDLVLPVFGSPPSQAKRSNTGPNVMHHDSPVNSNKLVLMSVLNQLRDSTALTIVISMLTRLYNVLRDESTLELQVDFIMLWPAVVSNANSYNTRAVCEVLKQIVMLALYYYPSNIPWLRLMGDINFANGHNEAALNFYLKSLSIATDYFNLPVRNDDHVFRRMIKSCNALGCNTQAAVLCQFLEEPDYVLAFHILAEQKLCNDAVDAYYHCFFDVNILEYLVHLHHKKGEFQRRKRAIQVIGLLELNSNNNEEIQREACNLRKSTFLRALCKQFLY